MLPKLSLCQICLKLAKWRLKFINVCPLSLFQAHREAALQNHKYVLQIDSISIVLFIMIARLFFRNSILLFIKELLLKLLKNKLIQQSQ